jgi:hypothetical protein
VSRTRDGELLHDGEVNDPKGCPRGRTDCAPLARYASLGFESFMCCGETDAAPVPTDVLRLCILSTHKSGVDVLVNLDKRDATDTASVLLAGLSALAQTEAHNERRAESDALGERPTTPEDSK